MKTKPKAKGDEVDTIIFSSSPGRLKTGNDSSWNFLSAVRRI